MLKEKILNTEIASQQIAVFYLGQEGFLIKYRDKHILFDPYLSDYIDRNCSSETTLWKRNYDSPINATELDFLDYVFCSHAHFDHADPETLSDIFAANSQAKFIVPAPIVDTIASYNIDCANIIAAEADKPFDIDGIGVLPIPSAHEILSTNTDSLFEHLGYVLQLGDTKIYHAGDCCVYDGLCDRLTGIDVGFLPINGRDYFRYHNDIIGNMDSREAVLLAKEARIKLLIPMHFDLYDVNEINPGYFVDTLFKLNRDQSFHIFTPGERLVYQR